MFGCTDVTLAENKADRARRAARDHGERGIKTAREAATLGASGVARMAGRAGLFDFCGNVEKSEAVVRQRGLSITHLRPDVDAGVEPMEEDGADRGGETPKAHRGSMEVRVRLESAKGLPRADFLGTADPYVEVRLVVGNPLEKLKVEEFLKTKSKTLDAMTKWTTKTQIIRGTLDPVWQETFTFQVPAVDDADDLHLYLRVYDYDTLTSHDFLGHLCVRLFEELAAGKELSAGWRALLRQCPSVRDKLELLGSEKLKTLPAKPRLIAEVPGQEGTYDLSKAELVFHAEALPKARAGNKGGVGRGGMQRPPGPRASAADWAQQGPGADEGRPDELLHAAAKGSVPQVRRLLRHGGSVNTRGGPKGEFPGLTPLHVACLRGHRDLAMALVDVFDASLVQPAPEGMTTAMCACQAGDETLAEWLVNEGVPADVGDEGGRNLLFYSAMMAMPQLTSWLLGKQHLDANARAKDGSTSLTWAVSSGLAAAVVVAQQLLEAKASANTRDRSGRAPLHAACEAGDDKCARLLLGTGLAKVDMLDSQGRTPAYIARKSGMPDETVGRLLQVGEVLQPLNESRQQPGESKEDAKKRELRVKKAAVSAAMDYSQWKAMHPPREMMGNNPADFPESARFPQSARSAGDHNVFERGLFDDDNIPKWIGGGRSSSQGLSGRAKSTSAFGRLKSWASSLRPRSLSRRRSASPGSPGLSPLVTPRSPGASPR